MYKRILVPTDGSRLSEEAVAAAVALAKAIGARVIAFHVAPEVPDPGLEAWAHRNPSFRDDMVRAFEEQAMALLEVAKNLALRAGVPCECRYIWSPSPAEEIVKAAAESRCDLIFMGSRGKGQSPEALLGSVAARVVALSRVPVLLHRGGARRAKARTKRA
jgi:nucleotide-binding universal stress UspA family protein